MTTSIAPITPNDILRAINFTPTDAQRAIINGPEKTQLVAGGWRGGKSANASAKAVLSTVHFISEYPEQASSAVAWLVANNYELNRAEFNYITAMLRRFYPGVTASLRVDPGEIRIPVAGGNFTIKTKSASDPQTLAMEAPVWVVVCEAAQVSQETFENLKGRISEARIRWPEFGWIHFEGTFEGSLGWYAALWQKWQVPSQQEAEDAKSYSLPSHSNTHLYPEGENDPEFLRIKDNTPEHIFSEKYLGVPVPPSGRVHKSFDAKLHIRPVTYDPDLPVYLGIDPGYSGQPSTYAVEAAQLVTLESGFQQWRVFDEIRVNKHSMAGFTVKDVCETAMGRYWWSNPDKKGIIDVAGETHAGAQESNAEVWLKVTGLALFAGRVPVQTSIDRVDQCLKQDPITREPGVVYDPGCELVISELGGGPNPFDGETHVYSWMTNQQNEVVGKTPKDAYCDGIKAFAYMAYHVQGAAMGNNARKSISVRSKRRKRRRAA